MVTNLRMRLEQIGFVPKRIAPQGEQGVFLVRVTRFT